MHGAEKAGFITFVTGCADLFDLNEDGIPVAIKSDVLNGLRVATALAFHPESLARPAPEMRLAGGDGFLKRCAIHPGHHENATSLLLLNDGWEQAGDLVKFQLVVKTHV